MKTQKRRVKRRLRFNLLNFTGAVFITSGLLFLFSAICIRTYNNTLSSKAQSIQSQISTLSTQNTAVEIEIRQLASADRVDQVAANSGLSYNQDSIITVSGETSDGE